MKSEHIMVIIGFVMILLNALDYIFHWDYIPVAIGIIGIVFVAIGMRRIKKDKKSLEK